jgi:hypothetical protein
LFTWCTSNESVKLENVGHGAPESNAANDGFAMNVAFGFCGIMGGRERRVNNRGLFGVERVPSNMRLAADAAADDVAFA